MILLDCNHGNESVIALHTAKGARKGSKTILFLLRHAKRFHTHGTPWKVIGNSKGWGGGRGWKRHKRLSLQGKYGVTCELTFPEGWVFQTISQNLRTIRACLVLPEQQILCIMSQMQWKH